MIFSAPDCQRPELSESVGSILLRQSTSKVSGFLWNENLVPSKMTSFMKIDHLISVIYKKLWIVKDSITNPSYDSSSQEGLLLKRADLGYISDALSSRVRPRYSHPKPQMNLWPSLPREPPVLPPISEWFANTYLDL